MDYLHSLKIKINGKIFFLLIEPTITQYCLRTYLILKFHIHSHILFEKTIHI